MLILQCVLYCMIYWGLVVLYVHGDARNCLYFYPNEYKKMAFERGIADEDKVLKKRKFFLCTFLAANLVVLLLFVGIWNRAATFWEAYGQTILLMLVCNWFDGIVIDEFWVRGSKLWRIKGMEGIPYAKSWGEMLKRRLIGSAVYLVIAAPVAGLALLL